MSEPKRVRVTWRTKGGRKPAGVVCVGRPSLMGNPYRVGVHGDAAECVRLYRLAMTLQCQQWLDHLHRHAIDELSMTLARKTVPTLRGKDLACWCPIGQPCHADVLLELANG